MSTYLEELRAMAALAKAEGALARANSLELDIRAQLRQIEADQRGLRNWRAGRSRACKQVENEKGIR